MKDRNLFNDLIACKVENVREVLISNSFRLTDEFWGDVISESGIKTVSARDVDLVLNSLKAG